MLGAHQNLVGAKQQLCPLAADQHAMLPRHHHIGFRQAIAHRPRLDQDRSQAWVLPHLVTADPPRPDPAHHLRSVVARHHHITDPQLLYHHATLRRGNFGSRRETRHDVFNIAVVQRANNIAAAIQKIDHTAARNAGRAHNVIGCLTGQVKHIIAAAAVDHAAKAGVNRVVANAAIQAVNACAAKQHIVAIAACQQVVAVTTA